MTLINGWLRLKLNHDKTELLVLHSKFRPRPLIDTLVVVDTPVIVTNSARNIGVLFDTCMNFEQQVRKICKAAFYHIRNISKARGILSADSTETLIHAFVTSRIDNCNVLLYGLPKRMMHRLQHVLNCAARLVTLSRKANHITPILIQLHWLPVEQRVIYKVLLYTFKIVNGLAPTYLSDLVTPYVPTRNLRSADKLLLKPTTYRLETYGSRAFSVCAPTLWNALPTELRMNTSIDIFKRKLKTHLFKIAFD